MKVGVQCVKVGLLLMKAELPLAKVSLQWVKDGLLWMKVELPSIGISHLNMGEFGLLWIKVESQLA